jgi:hypothetical protein
VVCPCCLQVSQVGRKRKIVSHIHKSGTTGLWPWKLVG